MSQIPSSEDQLADLFNRVRKLALNQHPLEDSGVTMAQLTLLEWVDASPGCGIQDMASGIGLTASTVSVGARRLAQGGLLERQPDPDDGRAIQLYPSAQGKTLCRRARALRRDKMRRLLRGLTVEEGATLVALLQRAVNAAEVAEEAETEASG